MKIQNKHTIAAVLFITAIALVLPFSAQAAGTAAGTSIANKAAVGYSVNGTAQTGIESSPTGNALAGVGNGTNTTFVVDDKVIVSITDNNGGTAVNTSPGSTGLQALKFTVTNGGNLVHDFVVTATNIADTITGGPATATLYEDTNGNGTFDPGIDQPYTGAGTYLKNSAGTAYIDELAVDASRTIFVVVTVPGTATNTQTANFSLTADAHQGSGALALGALTKTQADIDATTDKNASLANLNTQYIVLADAAQDGDGLHDGKFTRNGTGGFLVQAVALNVSKTATVISDPVGGAFPKAIPLAIVEYTITVTYAVGGSGTATNLSLSDTVPTDTVAQLSVYAGNTEVERKTVSNGGAVVTTPLDSTVLTAPQSWGTAAGSTIKVDCGAPLVVLGDYCQIKYQVQIQ